MKNLKTRHIIYGMENILTLSDYRKLVLNRINEFEKEGRWNEDVEQDPPCGSIKPDEVDYLNKKRSSAILTKLANFAAIRFYEKMIKNGDMIIKDIVGLENFRAVKGGAILTCNHFNICDNYAVYRAIKNDLPKGHQLYKVIREGNYKGFNGLYGFLFRHCNTLPLSRNIDTMKSFYSALSTLLERGEKVLVYPEQSMWWNYKKPRPLKNGAFRFAAKSNVPIIPVFITMESTDKEDADGYPVQAYTLHFMPAVYPKEELSLQENVNFLREENSKVWKDVYEDFYKVPLEY